MRLCSDLRLSLICFNACSPLTFFVPPIAHLLPYGLIKDFWYFFLVDIKKATSNCVLDRDARNRITIAGQRLLSTGGFKKVYTDIVRCVRGAHALGEHVKYRLPFWCRWV